MKKYMISIVAGIGVVMALAVGVVYVLSHGHTSTDNIHVSSVSVSSSTVSFTGGFAGSAMWYNGYTATYKDGSLYLDIQVSSIQLPGLAGDPFTVSIPNTYGDIKQIYLRGQSAEGDKQIWPQN